MLYIKKRYLIPGITLLVLAVFLFFLSDIAKNYLVKNSEKLIHRKIEIGELHINYAKVAVQVKNFVMYEDNKTDQFASFSEFYINLNPWTLLQNEYSVSEIRLVEPKLQIIQNGDKFNFDSLMPKDSAEAKKDTTTVSKVLKFTIRNILLKNGQLKYVDVQKKNDLNLKDLNLNLPLIAWNNEKSDMGVDFTMGENGRVNVQATVDNINKKYQIDLATQNVDIQPIKSYMTDYFDVRSLSGALTSNLKIVGDMNEVINIAISGQGTVSDFSITDGRSEKIISAPKVSASINEMNLKTFHFGFGKIEVNQPKLLVVRDKKAMNVMQFFAPYFRNDSIAAAAGPVQETSTPVTYRIDTIKVNNGLVSIADNTLNRPFKYDINDLNMTMTGLTESADEIPVEFNTKLNNKGELSGKTVWSMLDFMKLQMNAKVKRMDLVSFSPYSEYYVASPITQGWISYDLGLKMTTTTLNNTNKVEIDELEFGKRTKDTTAMKVPVRLALYIMKDKNDQIKFDLPVTGNPSEPKFKLGKIIWKTFANLMVKTALSPFNALASLAGANPESMDKLPFAFAQDSLTQKQRDDLTKLATILKKKPDLAVAFSQTTNPEKEKAQIALELTKKEFAASQNSDPSAPKTNMSAIKNDDAELLAFIRKSIPAVDSLGVEAACVKRIEASRIDARFQEILDLRNKLLVDFLVLNQGIPAEAVQVSTADLRTLPLELRVPQFKVEVSIK